MKLEFVKSRWQLYNVNNKNKSFENVTAQKGKNILASIWSDANRNVKNNF